MVKLFLAGRGSVHAFMNWQTKERPDVEYVLNARVTIVDKLAQHGGGRRTADQGVMMAAVGPDRVVTRLKGTARADGDGLLSERQMGWSGDLALAVERVDPFLEGADERHVATEAQVEVEV